MDLIREVKAILFDAGGILFTTKFSRDERIRVVLKSLGISQDVIENAIKKGNEFFSSFNESGRWISNWSEEKELFSNYYSVVVKEINSSDVYRYEKLFNATHYVNHCILYPEVIDVLDSLSKYYKLGVISNAYPGLDQVFDKLNIRKIFDVIVISAFVGKAKPERLIYEKALEEIKFQPNECLFIDNKAEYVAAAEGLGMKGIHIDRKNNGSLSLIKEILL